MRRTMVELYDTLAERLIADDVRAGGRGYMPEQPDAEAQGRLAVRLRKACEAEFARFKAEDKSYSQG
jgi:hypothetical protein